MIVRSVPSLVVSPSGAERHGGLHTTKTRLSAPAHTPDSDRWTPVERVKRKKYIGAIPGSAVPVRQAVVAMAAAFAILATADIGRNALGHTVWAAGELMRRWYALFVAAVVVQFAIGAYLRARRPRPRFERSEVVYQEWFASGLSERNFFTTCGGAHNCLRLVVTREMLWVTSWPPFSFLTPLLDLEHVVPLQSIISVERSRSWWVHYVLLTYSDASGRRHTLELMPKHLDRFLDALDRPAGGERRPGS